MVIPISGPISDKDMALTGIAAGLPGHKSKFPFLYNFDGLEGELDFLTRVVVLTFYPAESTCSPVTLGEVRSTLNMCVCTLYCFLYFIARVFFLSSNITFLKD